MPSSKGGLAGALFSQVQQRVLGLLVGQPDREFHASEVIRLVHSGSGAVQRELKKLADAGVLTVKVSANRKVYRANRESPIFPELHGLILKTVGLVEPLRMVLRKFAPDIDVAFVYGSIAKGTDTARSDIDLMIIGRNMSYDAIYTALQRAEKTLLRPVNPNLMTSEDWKARVAAKNSFANKIAQQPKIFVLGSEHEL